MLSSAAMLIFLMSAGCVCGRFGTLAQRRTTTKTAEVIDHFCFGAVLRPWGTEAAFAIGWQHATYIYPRERKDGSAEAVSWTFGWVPPRRKDPFFLALSGVGAGIMRYPTMLQSYVGIRTDSFTFAARVGESRVVKFYYRPGAAEETSLTIIPFPSMISKPAAWLNWSLACLFVGCATPSHLVFHQCTSIGADASTNTTTGQVNVSIGYDRQTNTLIPKTNTLNDIGAPEAEAMSVISASEVKIKWLGLHRSDRAIRHRDRGAQSRP